MQVKLTALALPSLPASKEPYRDTVMPGLALHVGKRTRTWIIRVRQAGGSRQPNIIGYWLPDSRGMSLAEARQVTGEIIARVDAGLPTSLPIREAAHPRSSDALTLGKLIARYEHARRLKGGRIKQIDMAMRTVRNNLQDHLALPAIEFSKQHLRDVRDKIARRAPVQANRFLAYCGPVMKWAVAEDLVATNFVPEVLKVGAETKRERTLTREEISAIWRACEGMTGGRGGSRASFGRLVRFALLTLQRRDECASLKHGDVIDHLWGQRQNKSDRPHKLRLPPLAFDLLGRGEVEELVFGGFAGKISGYSKLKRELDRLSGVTDWRLHDLRRTGASAMQELGVDEMVIRAVLNHSIPGVAQNYLRATLDKAKAKALACWADELERIVGKAG